MKHAQLDPTGKILGWYSEEIHGENIPDGCVELSDEVWQRAINEGHNTLIDGVSSFVAPKQSDEDIRAEKIATLDKQILFIEQNRQPRAQREESLEARGYTEYAGAGARLKALDDEIGALRAQRAELINA